jgi:hypothetical protein
VKFSCLWKVLNLDVLIHNCIVCEREKFHTINFVNLVALHNQLAFEDSGSSVFQAHALQHHPDKLLT